MANNWISIRQLLYIYFGLQGNHYQLSIHKKITI